MLSLCLYPFGSSIKISFVARAILTEFLGTMILLSGVLTIKKEPLACPLLLTMAIWICGPISGGHLNPIVSFIMLLQRKIGIIIFFLYVLAQVIGALIGSVIGLKLLQDPEPNSGMLFPQPNVDINSAFWTETYVAAFFSLVVLASTNDFRDEKSSFNPRTPGLTPILIGLSTSIVGEMAREKSGGSVNPARSLGPALANQNFENQWIYMIAPFLGALIATIIYTLAFDETITWYRIKRYIGLTKYDPNYDEEKQAEI